MTSAVRLYLFDDARARRWLPYSLTRPVGELLHGCLLQRERAARVFDAECVGHLVGPELDGFREEGTPPVVTTADIDERAPRLLLSSRAVPEGEPPELEPGRGMRPLLTAGTVVGWFVPPGEPLPSEDTILRPWEQEGDDHGIELDGTLLEWPWDLVTRNAERIGRDLEESFRQGDSFLLGDVHVVGDHVVSLGEGAKVEPGVVLDLREGPIRLEAGVRIQGPARLAGPAWIGTDTRVLGGSLARVSVGPVCKVRGEVEDAVFLGYCNKAHDGYLGHAYLGKWVNLGALTTNSDLKNNYGSVRVPIGPDEEVDTGLLKVGALVGDHVKTGIGTLLGTGSVLGAGSNVFGGGTAPKWLPPFSWGGDEVRTHRLDAFLETARKAMERRGVELEDDMRELLSRAWRSTEGQRG